MREFWFYVVPAVLSYPAGLWLGKRLGGSKARYWSITIGTLVLMVAAVGVASLGGDAAWVAIPVGIAFGVVLGLRHGFTVVPALFGAREAEPQAEDPAAD